MASQYFYPRSPCGERLINNVVNRVNEIFLSTLSLRRATLWVLRKVPLLSIFLSTLSLRRATRSHRGNNRSPINFYPRSPCGERLTRVVNSTGTIGISIHALLAESDIKIRFLFRPPKKFLSTLSLRRATFGVFCPKLLVIFLSTLSLRRATIRKRQVIPVIENFYPRSPCGERRSHYSSSRRFKRFLSTLSLRRATQVSPDTSSTQCISIHALLAESDIGTLRTVSVRKTFLSTLSLRRATPLTSRTEAIATISIHALLAESDRHPNMSDHPHNTFLSTLSLRRATRRESRQQPAGEISIHALLAESDADKHAQPPTQLDFYPRSPCGERLGPLIFNVQPRNFYPRSPCGERLYHSHI